MLLRPSPTTTIDSVLGTTGRVVFHVGAYSLDTISLRLTAGFSVSGLCTDFSVLSNANQITAGAAYNNATTGVYTNAGEFTFAVGSQSSAEGCIAAIDKIINVVDTHRAALGALQNRMESTIRNQENVAENVSDARSRIRDADYAAEAANLSAQNITQQAATTVLTQANQRPQIALNLLGG